MRPITLTFATMVALPASVSLLWTWSSSGATLYVPTVLVVEMALLWNDILDLLTSVSVTRVSRIKLLSVLMSLRCGMSGHTLPPRKLVRTCIMLGRMFDPVPRKARRCVSTVVCM